MTNLPWYLDADAVAKQFGIARVLMVNDFEAAATGVEALAQGETAMLQRGEPVAAGRAWCWALAPGWAWPTRCRRASVSA